MTSPRFRIHTMALALVLLAASACVHQPQGDEEEPAPKNDPIAVHVRNDNFLDMDVYAIVGGARRRLGMVSGNSAGDFSIDWDLSIGQSISVIAVPIGGRGTASTGSLNIGFGQMIDFTVASVLQQSRVSVHEPP
jgi:hypothetical protein